MKNIVIVGASIAGMSCAIELERRGLSVNLLERAKQPLSDRGAGATKAIQDAMLLAECFSQSDSTFSQALKNWDQQQSHTATNMFNLSQRIGNFMVTKMPDWSALNKNQVDEMWQAVIAGQDWYIVKKD